MNTMKHMKTLKLFTAAAAIVTATLPPQVQAQAICSCSPIEYNFQLNFDGKCDDGTTSSDDFVKGDAPVCFYTLGSAPNDGGDIIGDSIDIRPPPAHVRRLDSNIIGGIGHDIISSHHDQKRWEERALGHIDLSSQIKHAQTFAQQQQQQKQRKTQSFDTTPTVITSVTFLEFDSTVQDIINQDSTYFNTTLANGAVMDFTSISSQLNPEVPLEDQMEFVPGGIMLVLFGINAEEEVIQNTVAWSYDNDYCEAAAPLEVVDNGWVELIDLTEAKSMFCPASVPTTTAAPNSTTEAPDGTETEATSHGNAPVLDAKAGKSAKAENAPVLDAKAAKGSKSAKATADPEEPTTKSAKAEKGESSKAEKDESSKAEKAAPISTTDAIMAPKSAKVLAKAEKGESSSKAVKAVVLDAKAEKNSKVAKAFDAAKAAKLQKTDTLKGGKSSKASRDDAKSDAATPAPKPTTTAPTPSTTNPDEEPINNNTRPPIPEPTVTASDTTNNEEPIVNSPTDSPLAAAAPEISPFPTMLDRPVVRSGENGVKFGRTKDGSSATAYSAATAVAGNSVFGGGILIAMVLLEGFYWIL